MTVESSFHVFGAQIVCFWNTKIMQRGGADRDDLFRFGGPFGGFAEGFGRRGSLTSGFFGGKHPFDDPFFTQPFCGMVGPPNLFGHSASGVRGVQGDPLGCPIRGGLLEDQAPQLKISKEPIIQELSSDDEADEQEEKRSATRANTIKNSRPDNEPFVLEPVDELDERNTKLMQRETGFERAWPSKPKTGSFSFHSSTVTYGGPGGPYYTSSTTRRTGGDGVTVEESREADTTTGQASHRFSRGLGDRGHSVTRKLNPDGRVDTVQTLHNLGEDELLGFEEAWKGNARYLPGWNPGLDMPSERCKERADGSRGVQAGRTLGCFGTLPPPEQSIVRGVERR